MKSGSWRSNRTFYFGIDSLIRFLSLSCVSRFKYGGIGNSPIQSIISEKLTLELSQSKSINCPVPYSPLKVALISTSFPSMLKTFTRESDFHFSDFLQDMTMNNDLLSETFAHSQKERQVPTRKSQSKHLSLSGNASLPV